MKTFLRFIKFFILLVVVMGFSLKLTHRPTDDTVLVYINSFVGEFEFEIPIIF